MPRLIDLESAYTNVQLVDSSNLLSQYDSIDDLQKKHELRRRKRGGRRTFQPEVEKGIQNNDIPDELQYRLVLGEAGAGKSTYLKKIGLEALKGKKWNVPSPDSGANRLKAKFLSSEKYCIPVFLELRNLVNDLNEPNEKIDFKSGLIREFEICNFPWPDEFVEAALAEGSLLILLDGLDEIPSTKIIPTTAAIRDFVDRYSKNRFILSSRPAAYVGSSLTKFEVVKVSILEDAQIKDFLRKWFASQTDEESASSIYSRDNEQEKYTKLAEECWKLLSSTKIDAVKELAQTPLLLNLICIAFNDNKCLPENRALLYQQALQALMKTWSREKLITPEPIYQNFNYSLEIGMLSEFAYNKFSDKIYFFARKELIEMISSFLQDNLNAPPGLDGEEILRAIEIQQGILVRRSTNNYSFSHLTFQEFLTAQYIASDPRRMDNLIAEHLISVRWREIFVITAGVLVDGADELLAKMQQDSQKFINSPNLKGLLGWAEQITDSLENKENLLSKRAAALCIATYFADVGSQKFRDVRLKESAVALASSKAITRILDKRLADSAAAIRTQAVISLSADISSLEGYRRRVNALIDGIRLLEMFQIDFVLFRANAARMSERLSSQNLDEKSLSKQIWQAWLKNFKLNPKFLYLSEDEIVALQRYLYITSLILACKSAANRLSRRSWSDVSDKMLRAR